MNNICKVDGCEKLKDKSQGSSMCTMHRVRWGRYKSHNLPKKPSLPHGIVKVCKIHGNLTHEQAYTNEKYKAYQCLECKKDANERFSLKNPNRDTNSLKRNIYIKNGKIKVPKDLYLKMHEEQKGLCAICGLPETMNNNGGIKPKRLAIDHCHKTDEIRQLLCHHCNVSLGGFRDSIVLLELAIKYLKKHGAT
jgi:hypothetical protein